ncbi:MAG: DUF255 domain-containing protein [Balneolales bacterium]|nr:DUF255 domain-containing protein [Balneolales bacterium]
MSKKVVITIGIAAFVAVYLVNALKNTAPLEIENAPEWRTIAEAQEEARETEKLILVDVFEIGCKYCRAMEQEVYPDSTVRAVLDAGYIPAKVDGNSTELITFNGQQMEARKFAQDHGVFVFPGTLILDAEGNLVKQRTGFMNVDELRQFLY